MRELYKISFLPNEFNCFFHLNRKKLSEFSSLGCFSYCIKVEFGTDLSSWTYSFLSSCHSIQLSDNQIGISAVYAQSLGIREEDDVLISAENAKSLTSVKVVPQSKKDYELVTKYFDHLENSILNQVKIVAKGQTVPIQLHSNIIISLKVGLKWILDIIKSYFASKSNVEKKKNFIVLESLTPEALFGELQQSTELVVADPPEIPEIDFVIPQRSKEPSVKEKTDQANFFNFVNTSNQTGARSETDASDMSDHSQKKFLFLNNLMKAFTQFWKGDNSQQSIGNEEDKVPQISYCQETSVFRVNTSLVIEKEFPKSLRDKCIITRRLPVTKKVHGPCCFKIFCKVQKVHENPKGFALNPGFEFYTFAYVVKLNDGEDELNNDAYCPDFLLKILHLRIGSFVNIVEVKRKKESMYENHSNSLIRPSVNPISHDIFTEEMKKIYESTINAVVTSMRFKEKINTLIVGETGTGKTFLLDSVMLYFEEKLLLCRKIDCKKLRKMKISTLIKLFNTTLSECCNFQPSILFIDDLDALLIADEEENHFKTLYSERIGNLLTCNFNSYQKLNDISIVATISSMSNFKYMTTDRGPTMFENICEISELDSSQREHILTHLISQKYPKSKASFVDYITSKTKGYNIQDLHDLVEIAAFKSLSRNKSESYELEKIDFESALSEKVPLSLYGVNLSKNSHTNWNDVGGLEEPKKLLKEMFEWPLKYREIYQSCPLRLQCGVLLYGAPGTGKTLIASAVASECGLNFISVKGPEIFSRYVGASEQGIRDLFQRARKAKPCLLFFDEFDSLAPRRGSSNEDVNDRVVNQILTELDGVEELTEVFVLAATSRPDLLDPALLRPGRIDKAIHCGLPGKEERLSILKALSKSLRLSDDVDFDEIASRTDGYTGADLQAVLYAAQTALVKEIDKENTADNNDLFKIKISHLMAGLALTKPSISKEEKLKYQAIYEHFISSRMGGVLERSQEAMQKIMFA